MRINAVTVARGQQSELIELIKADPHAHARMQAQTRGVEINPHQKAVWLHRELASSESAERGYKYIFPTCTVPYKIFIVSPSLLRMAKMLQRERDGERVGWRWG